MGGTQFNGLALVWELSRAGHDVAILNRGKTEARLPSGVSNCPFESTMRFPARVKFRPVALSTIRKPFPSMATCVSIPVF